MAQNDQRRVVGRLTIKHSKWSGLTDPDAYKLSRSLDLARCIVAEAYNILHPITLTMSPGSETISQSSYLVLRYQFRLPNLVGADARAKREWPYNVLRICNTMRMIELGLLGPVSIADSYSTTVGRAVEDARLGAEADISLAGQQWPAQKKAAAIDAAKRDAAMSADRVAMSSRGMVPMKKAVGLSFAENGMLDRWLNKDPTLRMKPEQYGSIHLNFPDLLQNPAVSLVCVARTIIHEGSHKFCDTRDFAYADAPEYRALTLDQAIWNADSYAYAAVSLYKGIVFQTHRSMAAAPAGVDMNS